VARFDVQLTVCSHCNARLQPAPLADCQTPHFRLGSKGSADARQRMSVTRLTINVKPAVGLVGSVNVKICALSGLLFQFLFPTAGNET
jgi:hypothetical protein